MCWTWYSFRLFIHIYKLYSLFLLYPFLLLRTYEIVCLYTASPYAKVAHIASVRVHTTNLPTVSARRPNTNTETETERVRERRNCVIYIVINFQSKVYLFIAISALELDNNIVTPKLKLRATTRPTDRSRLLAWLI